MAVVNRGDKQMFNRRCMRETQGVSIVSLTWFNPSMPCVYNI